MQHTHTRTETVTETALVTCDRCHREMAPNDLDGEHQERIAIRFRAGYSSVFGDGNLVEADLCQHCVKEVLGPWLRVTVDDPFEPAHTLDGKPKGAYQENQLPGREAGAEEPGRSGWPSADE
jgi:hypothetical protein